MEEFAIDLNPAAVVQLERLSARGRFAAYMELTKPRITFLIVLTSAAGFALASHAAVNYAAMVSAMVGIALLSSGIATINQYMERDLDALMRRTANRPLPSGRLLPSQALTFGVGLIVGAEIYLAVLVNPLTALLGLTVIAGYLFGYTPTEDKNLVVDNGRRLSRSGAAINWLGSSAWICRYRSLGAVRDSVPVAVSPFPGDCLDVS